jgi:hypothetical protein
MLGTSRSRGGRIPAGLWARVVQRLLALQAVIWFNWQIGAPIRERLTGAPVRPTPASGQNSANGRA